MRPLIGLGKNTINKVEMSMIWGIHRLPLKYADYHQKRFLPINNRVGGLFF